MCTPEDGESGMVPLCARCARDEEMPRSLWITHARENYLDDDGRMSTTTSSIRSRPRALWSDARFLLGVVLVVVSIAGVWWVVTAAKQTAPVFVAARTLVPGEALVAADLQIVEAALGGAGDAYATPQSMGAGLVMTRTVDAGEMIPLSAVGAADDAASTTIVVRSSGDIPAGVRPGSVVELWVVAEGEDGRYAAPRVLVPRAIVASVDTDDSMMAAGGAQVEMVIARTEVADTLAAQTDGARLSIVPISAVSP